MTAIAAAGKNYRRYLSLLSALALTSVPGLAAQDLLTAQDVVALPSPAPDHRIPYGTDSLQFGHLRLPDGAGPHPVVLFIHGGCWLAQYDIGHTGPLEQALADSGYAVWSLEYRRTGNPGGGWPGTFRDIARGADHMRQLAPAYGLDLTRLVAAGHSAGGHLALWLAARDRLPADSDLYTEDPIPIHGVLALAPAPDLEGLHADGVCGNVIDRLMGGPPTEVATRYRHASPMWLTPLAVPQVLIVGRHDRAWAPVGRRYYERARANGARRVTLVEAPESGHFEMIVPRGGSWSVVVEGLRVVGGWLGSG